MFVLSKAIVEHQPSTIPEPKQRIAILRIDNSEIPRRATFAPGPVCFEWIKVGQRIIGALLWLSTWTRPDLSCAVSLAIWHHRLSSKISRSSRIDLGIYSNTLSQQNLGSFQSISDRDIQKVQSHRVQHLHRPTLCTGR